MDFKSKYSKWVDIVNTALDNYITVDETLQKTIYSAMKYSIDAGGKRLRPILALAVCEFLNGDIDEVLPFACGIEMIHTYSLIHDDLPAMDNDDLRRGRPTNHKVFGDAIAILAGDALLNAAFEIMSESILVRRENMESKVKAMSIIAKSSGTCGMIGGQVIDLESENKKVSQDILMQMHNLKTMALISAPIISSAVICGAEQNEMECLNKYSKNIGLAFQIKDDILDVEGDETVLGKKVGSDVNNNKSTFATLHGLDESKKLLENLTREAIGVLDVFGERAWFLKDLASGLADRNS